MKFFTKSKDGGPESPVDAYFFFEIKSLCTVALLRFNPGSREALHTHAFNALTWFLWGQLLEEHLDSDGWLKYSFYRRSLFPKITRRSRNHRVIADRTSWCFTIRGPWSSTWTEDTETHHTVLTHGRKIVSRIEK